MVISVKNIKLLKDVIAHVRGETDFHIVKNAKINGKICSINPDESRKRKIGTEYASQLKDADIVKLRKYFKKVSPKKHQICLLAFILGLIEDEKEILINKVLLEQYKKNVIITKIADWIINPQKTNILEILGIKSNKTNNVSGHNEVNLEIKSNKTNNVTIKKKILSKDWSFLIKDFFNKDTGFYDSLKLLSSTNNKIVDNLYEFIINKRFDNKDYETKSKELISKLSSLNPVMCKVITAPVNSPENPYKNWQFRFINEFININDGYCYGYNFLGSGIIAGRGKIDLQGAKINQNDILRIARGIAFYYDKYPELQKEEIGDYIKTYNTFEMSLLTNYIHKLPMKFNEIYNLFKYLMINMQDDITNNTIKLSMEWSCNTVIELIGFMGYILCSDDYGTLVNKGDKFEISQYCISQLLDFLNKIKYVKVKQDCSLYDWIKNLSIDGIHLDKLINELSENCIHQMGNNFIKFYIKCHSLTEKYISTHNKNNTLCIPDDLTSPEYNELYKLSPYLISINDDLKSKTDIRYLSTIRTDSINKSNIINTKWHVIGFCENGDYMRLFYIDGSYKYKSYNIDDISNCFVKNGDYIFHEYDKKWSSIMNYYKIHQDKLIDLIRISYIFQKNRKLSFLMYKDYALHICKLINADYNEDKLYKSIKIRCSIPYTNVITLNEVKHIPKWMGIISIKNNKWIWESQDKHNVNINNANNSKINKEYYIDGLQNIFQLNYNYDSNENKASVYNPYNQRNITRVFQYGKLLEKMLFHTGFNNIKHGNIFSIDDSLLENIVPELWSQFGSYYLKVYGQASEIIDNYWNRLDIEFYKWGKISINGSEFVKIKPKITNREEKNIIKIIENLNCLNIIDSIHEIANYSHNVKIHGFINIVGLIDELLIRLRLFIDILKAYYIQILPFNYDNKSNNFYYQNISSIINIKLYFTISSFHTLCNNNTIHKKNICKKLKTYYYKIMLYPILAMFPEGWDLSTYQYNFTEMESEVFIIKQMKSRLINQPSPHTAQYKRIINFSTHKPHWTENFEKLLPIINDTFFYYSENNKEKLNLQIGDDQESIKIQFEYWLKIQLFDKHLLRMTHWSQLEKFFLLFSNIDSNIRFSTHQLHTLNSLKKNNINNNWNNSIDFYKSCIAYSVDNKNYITFLFSIMQNYL